VCGFESLAAPKTRERDGQQKIWLCRHDNGVLLQKRVPWFVEMAMLALFSLEKILVLATVAFSFVCDKYCAIMN